MTPGNEVRLKFFSFLFVVFVLWIICEVWLARLKKQAKKELAARKDLEHAITSATDRPVDINLLVAARGDMIPLQPLPRRRHRAPNPEVFMMSGAIQHGDPLSSTIPEHFNMPDPVQDRPASAPSAPSTPVPARKIFVRKPVRGYRKPVRVHRKPLRKQRRKPRAVRPVVKMETVLEE
ncbi:hypothetical protein B0T22DRAFT_444448 [Podospora appendiculata]|uniref:Uncharacterized protein n=1 Tax=Podospora appendiculata TaxID=314037 RepID=A0AAE0X0L5_9PEZI|nr:hypothetical protein B0T22DRAFT_444448 [Podospora appendiculata]